MARNWQGKRVVIVGLARQGKALARYLSGEGAQVMVTDRKPAADLRAAMDELSGFSVEYEFGGHPASLLENTSALFLSGGVPADIPLAVQARSSGIPVLNDAQLFLERTRALTVGISGSAGKSTTTAWVGEIGRTAAAASGSQVWVGGNLGRPLLLDLDHMKASDVAVLELSSFQLEVMTAGVDVAALLNLMPDHLDRHGTLEAYREAKSRLLRNQTGSAVAVLNRDDPGVWSLRSEVSGELAAFSRSHEVDRGSYVADGQILIRGASAQDVLVPVDAIRPPGLHNTMNALAAAAVAAELGWPVEAIREGLVSFEGLPHRLELVTEIDGVRWINDSIATSPGRAAAGIEAVPGELIVLLGGRDKGLDWSPVMEAARGRARRVLLFGEAAELVHSIFLAADFKPALVERFESLQEAVDRARVIAEEGQAVLLSPGGTSFDEFVDFEARGEAFRRMAWAR